MALDQMVASQNHYKRFFIAVEGFTDQSRLRGLQRRSQPSARRCRREYLVGQHDIPIYRIHMVGLGKDKPVEDATNPGRQREEPPR